MSGHKYYADRFFGFDDAIYASARLLEILSATDLSLSTLLSDLPETFTTPEIRVFSTDLVKFQSVEEVKNQLAEHYPIIDIDGVRATFPHGWALVRASNTQEAIVLRFEADSMKHLDGIRREVEGTMEDVITRLQQ